LARLKVPKGKAIIAYPKCKTEFKEKQNYSEEIRENKR
jgi:hypothetical protein